ncbi:MAG: DUF2238 domain-containing protein [Thiomicrorhabdus sp.]|jgi:putative membrane protein|nr:DUF2238 domain-containing protein [Thiomicrorhabdus sp.]
MAGRFQIFKNKEKGNVIKIAWLLIFALVLIWSGIHPKDQTTWFLEVLPALVGLVVLALTDSRFRLTPLLYFLILVHCIILMVGGHYTYAEVPLFDWLKEPFDWSRNNYDKLGHLAQGFVPAMIAREIIIRKQIIQERFWQGFFIVSFCLAFSAFYELVEWWVALFSEEAAEAFLGTQGYIWDTQSDMLYALIGSLLALGLLSRWHNAQLAQLNSRK